MHNKPDVFLLFPWKKQTEASSQNDDTKMMVWLHLHKPDMLTETH